MVMDWFRACDNLVKLAIAITGLMDNADALMVRWWDWFSKYAVLFVSYYLIIWEAALDCGEDVNR